MKLKLCCACTYVHCAMATCHIGSWELNRQVMHNCIQVELRVLEHSRTLFIHLFHASVELCSSKSVNPRGVGVPSHTPGAGIFTYHRDIYLPCFPPNQGPQKDARRSDRRLLTLSLAGGRGQILPHVSSNAQKTCLLKTTLTEQLVNFINND